MTATNQLVRKRSARPAMRLLVLAFVTLACAACNDGNWWWTSFLDPTQVSGDFTRPMMSEIQRSLSFEDTPPGVPGAEEPTVEDTVLVLEPYRLEPEDTIFISIPQFVEYEEVTLLQPAVNEVGEIQIPQLGWIHVGGLTAKEVEAEIRDLSIQKGLFRAGTVPPITVQFPRQKQRFFNVYGGIPARIRTGSSSRTSA